MDNRILKGRGPTSFTIHGELCHRIGSLLPESDKSPSYSQLYIYDPQVAFDSRKKRNLHLDPAVLKIIQETLLQSNELCKIYKGAYDVLKAANNNGEEDNPIRLVYTSTTDPRRYNLPTSEDIAVIIPGDETVKTSKRDIILHLRNNNLERISECSPLYLSSHYVLLFPTDIVNNDDNPKDLGKRFILPSTHLGNPRHMYEIYQDSMAITRYNKHPDIFITVTANPKWPEIQNELKPCQSALDRPDLVARVFELKRKAIMDEIEKKEIFGSCSKDQVDKFVSAEFPDPIKHPVLFQTIKKCMVHECKSHYPRENVTNTRIDVDGYPIYRRRKTGKRYKVRGHLVDNRDVVPYNPYLSERFDCHINVEICASVMAVKYIHKYIYKDHDRTTMVVGAENDEIQQYLDARYVGPVEAAWRLYGFRIHGELPSVTRLALHLKGMHLWMKGTYTLLVFYVVIL
ncbi:hypothetical protein AQUCO_05000025v1 [Aquilegia coerulea]|uniref:Helitron helicase-like domain-containing protein n=1 Tax=Aquilegia coerulea TaxID=218851 RepID=A0A2G5CJ97_AQUCA|nr:hypothetical protein AQUCO_05000025v1 [Aquilegia coerulea]